MQDRVQVLSVQKCLPKEKEFYEIKYLQDGKEESKVVAKSKDVVKILLYHKEKNAFVLTKQFRPLLYINHPSKAFRIELCGGRVDKDLSLEQIAIEEVLEETGYKVSQLQKITTLYTSGRMTLYYAEIDESMRVNSGGGLDYEMIEVVYLPLEEAKAFMFDETIPKRPALMFSFCWFFHMKDV